MVPRCRRALAARGWGSAGHGPWASPSSEKLRTALLRPLPASRRAGAGQPRGRAWAGDRRRAGPSSRGARRCSLLPSLLRPASASAPGFPAARAAVVASPSALGPLASFVPSLTREPRRPTSVASCFALAPDQPTSVFSVPARRDFRAVRGRHLCLRPHPWPLRGPALRSPAFVPSSDCRLRRIIRLGPGRGTGSSRFPHSWRPRCETEFPGGRHPVWDQSARPQRPRPPHFPRRTPRPREDGAVAPAPGLRSRPPTILWSERRLLALASGCLEGAHPRSGARLRSPGPLQAPALAQGLRGFPRPLLPYLPRQTASYPLSPFPYSLCRPHFKSNLLACSLTPAESRRAWLFPVFRTHPDWMEPPGLER